VVVEQTLRHVQQAQAVVPGVCGEHVEVALGRLVTADVLRGDDVVELDVQPLPAALEALPVDIGQDDEPEPLCERSEGVV